MRRLPPTSPSTRTGSSPMTKSSRSRSSTAVARARLDRGHERLVEARAQGKPCPGDLLARTSGANELARPGHHRPAQRRAGHARHPAARAVREAGALVF